MNAERLPIDRGNGAGKLDARAEEIRRMYYEQNMTQVEIAVALGASQRGVLLFMRRHGMKPRPQAKRDQRGEKNDYWRGKAIGYKGAHQRVAAVRGKPQHCEGCGTTDQAKRYEWANLTGQYHDPADYKRLCKPCHAKHDGFIKNLGQYAKVPRE